MTAASSSAHLYSLVHYGSELAKLLHEAKIREGSIRRTISSRSNAEIKFPESLHEKVRTLMNGLLKDLEGGQGSIAQDSIAKVMAIVEGLLQKLGEIDKVNAKTYEDIALKVDNFTSLWRQSSAVAFSSSSSSGLGSGSGSGSGSVSGSGSGDRSSQYEQQAIPEEYTDDHEFELRYGKLTYDEKQCLFYFSMFPDGVELKKRELIYWWLGMMSLVWHSDGGEAVGEKVLTKLVAEGLIDRVIRTTKLSSRYRMRAGVRSKVLEQAAKLFSMHYEVHKTMQKGSFWMHYVGKTDEQKKHGDKTGSLLEEPGRIEALLNTGARTINTNTFVWEEGDWFSRLKNALVVHLGSWRGHHDDKDADYIVLEDMIPLKDGLQKLEKLRFLSLQGISGIVKLPDSVCELESLVVLDLRGCNNLESLPQGMGSLQELMHLDLSECYLLADIPREITSLSKLRVLKGFVINPDQVVHEAKGKGSKLATPRTSCAFSDLSELRQLNKLTVRTRRMNFPTPQEVQTLCEMEQLNTLRIAWVGQSSDAENGAEIAQFPLQLQKLELQGVPGSTASLLLGPNENNLEKLYIRGAHGRLDLMKYRFPHVKQVRLRYLPQLDWDWKDFEHSFPSLTRLQIFECPKLTSFRCGENGVWEKIVGESQ